MMPEYSIFEDSNGLTVGKQRYVGDVDTVAVINGKRCATKIKHYGNGYMKLYMSNQDVFGVSIPKAPQSVPNPEITGAEYAATLPELADTDPAGLEHDAVEDTSGSPSPERDRTKDVVRRAVENIFDIVLLNEDLRYFFTMTINIDHFDSRDPAIVAKKVTNWLRNQVQRRGLKYVVVAEYHPKSDDNKIHFHGLINDAFKFVDSGTRIVKGFKKPVKLETIEKYHIPDHRILRTVYNVPEWRHGFTTAIPVYGARAALARYIVKYILKPENAHNGSIFGKYYWSSRSCERRPVIEYRDDGGINFRNSLVKEYQCCGNLAIKYQNLGGDFSDADLDTFAELHPEFDRDQIKRYLKLSDINKNEESIERYKAFQREFERYLIERETRIRAEEKKKQEIRDLQAAERRARREWRDCQLSIRIPIGGIVNDGLRAPKDV